MYQRILYSWIFLVSLVVSSSLLAQTPIPKLGKVFKDDVVPRIDISIHPDSLDQLILLGSQGDNHHYLSRMVFDNGEIKDTVERVGFRLRGNTSRGSQKKSFKISFNTYEPGRKFYGLEKLNINGEHNDPSIIRSKLCWDMLREIGIPAPRANHVRLYVNNQYVGLYINVEHIDEEFADARFGNQNGNLYKCTWPATLEYLGSNPSAYKKEMWGKRPYSLQTNKEADDYSDLIEFIDVLNNTATADFECKLEKVFHVDAYLKVIAFDILTSNWDGPIFNKNNFYLYHNPATDLFEYIPFDLDNTFGIDWFIGDLATRDIYKWAPSNEERPIYTKILSHPPYRNRFSFYMQQILEEVFHPDILHPYLDSVKARIDEFVPADSFRGRDYGWDVNDYHTSFEEAIGEHVEYGLKPYIEERYASAISQLTINNIPPLIDSIQPPLPLTNIPLSFSAKVQDDESIATVEICYSVDAATEFSCIPMSQISSNIYTATLDQVNESASLNYYIKAVDNTGLEQVSPSCGSNILSIESRSLSLNINEIQAKNTTTISDEAGEFDDWIELYNSGEEPISLKDIYLTDDETRPDKWQFPDVRIGAKEYLLIWADEDQEQGDLHCNFKLSGSGEFIGLFEKEGDDFTPIDGFTFGEQIDDKSLGRLPDGIGELQEMHPTPQATNGMSTPTTFEQADINVTISPNPATHFVAIKIEGISTTYFSIKSIDALGQVVFEKQFSTSSNDAIIWDTSTINAGTYFIQILNKGKVLATKKVVILD